MSQFFDDSHVLDVGLEGSIGPRVGTWELVQQLYRQQFRVDSPTSLESELGSRWTESIRGLRAAGQNFNLPTDPRAYLRYTDFVRDGTPVTSDEDNPLNSRYGLPQLSSEFEEMRRANEAIRQLNNPNIRTFEQILEEVSEMQRGIEEETASMSERASTFSNIVGLAGSIAGSFTLRDPLNLATITLGAGRTVATRIAADMGIAGALTGVTEFTAVQPNRERADLPVKACHQSDELDQQDVLAQLPSLRR